jgi:hypothetical protein
VQLRLRLLPNGLKLLLPPGAGGAAFLLLGLDSFEFS